MKNLKLLSIAVLVFALSSKASFAADENKYVIEPNHTSVVWLANHFGFSNPSGKFSEVEGSIIFDQASPQKSVVDVTIKTESLFTGLEKFDKHLKSADFFNVDKFSTAKFVSKEIILAGKNKAKIKGNLTLLGITKTVILNAKFNKAALSPISQKQTIGFSATAVIKRSDFGLTYGIPGVSDEVNLMIEVEANR